MSVESVLSKHGGIGPDRYHAQYWWYYGKGARKHGYNADNYFKFAFVRNPWDMVVSHYEYRKRRRKGCRNLVKQYYLNGFKFFLDNMRLGRTHLKKQQCEFIMDWRGKSYVDYIGRFENFQEDFNTVCDKIGMDRHQLPHNNVSHHKHYTEYYDDETREIVAEKYARDIEYFGYKFGE